MKRLRKYKKASGDSINCSSHLTENLFQPNFGFPGNTNTGNINTGNACVQISHVTKCFGEELVLKEVNLTLNYGQVYGIVGNQRFRQNSIDEMYLRLSPHNYRQNLCMWKRNRKRCGFPGKPGRDY